MIQEKERGEITSEAEQLAGSVPSESAHGGPAPRKMVKCPRDVYKRQFLTFRGFSCTT